eukprot:3860168-Heterocapsa_arctica.AAC.1
MTTTPAACPAPAPGEAPLFTFYAYRAQSDVVYEPTNVNMANLAGVMWYMQHEVVILKPRKFSITR